MELCSTKLIMALGFLLYQLSTHVGECVSIIRCVLFTER